MDFLKQVKIYQKDLIKDLSDLLKIDTTLVEQPENKEAPFGSGIKEGLDFILDLGAKMGFRTQNIDNMIGIIEFGEGAELVGVLAHIDVVPAGDAWTYPAFSAKQVDNKIYARGAMDDKGPLMASLYAMKILKDSNIKLNKRIRLIVGTDEETAWRDIDCYLKKCEIPSVGFSPDASFPLIYGEKGLLSFDILSNNIAKDLISFTAGSRYNVVPEKAEALLQGDYLNLYNKFLEENNYEGKASLIDAQTKVEMFGKGAHAMNPELGINALIRLSEFISLVTKDALTSFVSKTLFDTRLKNIDLDFSDPEMKDLTMNVAIANFSKEKAKIGINLRYPINWPKADFFTKLSNLAKGLEVKILEDKVPHYVDKTSTLIKTLHNAYIKYTNDDKTPLLTIGGGTYARAFKNMVAYGMGMPDDEDLVHQANEYIKIPNLLTACAIYAEALYQLGK